VPDWDNTESRESDEDAAWRDLVARFAAPLTEQQPVPWPAREDMSAEPALDADGADGSDGVRGADGKHRGPEADGLGAEHGLDAEHGLGAEHGLDAGHGLDAERGLGAEHGRHAADGEHGRHAVDGEHAANGQHAVDGQHAANGQHGVDEQHAVEGEHAVDGEHGRHAAGGVRDEPGGIGGAAGRHGRLGAEWAYDPEVIQVPRTIRGPVARGFPPDAMRADDEEHFIPPAPPPLPKLDPMAKGAWVGLFGGPGYLMVATIAGWSVSGLAAFCAVAAFVAGFAVLVLRMHDPGPGGPDDGDNGAVV
jgi:hypothetical protein